MKDTLLSKTEILSILSEAIQSKIVERIENTYSSPLNKVVDEVVQENIETIREVANACLRETLGTSEFKSAVKEGFTHKIAKSMVGKLEGSVEKAVEELRQNPTLRAEMILAIENIIKRNQS